MLLPGPQCVMGPCTASHCCCLHRHTLPCATFRSPHTAECVMGPCTASIAAVSIATLCHVPLSGLLTLLVGPQCVMGPCTASHCCCLHRHTLPWAPVPPPHAAARPVICHGPLYRLLMLLPG
ncbi:unnamed protein product, partial [Staurois parvus]